eukprot:366244-Chlamydomonas_euryale.AAC.6
MGPYETRVSRQARSTKQWQHMFSTTVPAVLPPACLASGSTPPSPAVTLPRPPHIQIRDWLSKQPSEQYNPYNQQGHENVCWHKIS